MLATLRQALREGTPIRWRGHRLLPRRIASQWRSLPATAAQASGSTLRRWLADWARTDVLQYVRAMLVGMLRGQPDTALDLIVDSCSVCAKCCGDLSGPSPTDRAKLGTKYHVAVNGCSLPVACAAAAANVNDTIMFERLFRAAFVVMARIGTAFADKGYDAEADRDLCRKHGAEHCVHRRGQPYGSGLGKRRWSVARANAWLLENKRLGLRYDRLGHIIEACSRPHAYSWLHPGSLGHSENRLLVWSHQHPVPWLGRQMRLIWAGRLLQTTATQSLWAAAACGNMFPFGNIQQAKNATKRRQPTSRACR